jgi:hypothetical protein
MILALSEEAGSGIGPLMPVLVRTNGSPANVGGGSRAGKRHHIWEPLPIQLW